MIYRIGTSKATLASLQSLGIPIPSKADVVEYPEFITLGSGQMRGVGSLVSAWRFNFISVDELAVLRGFCAQTSTLIFITTLARSGAYLDYSGIALWTEVETVKGDVFLDFVLKFRNLVAV